MSLLCPSPGWLFLRAILSQKYGPPTMGKSRCRQYAGEYHGLRGEALVKSLFPKSELVCGLAQWPSCVPQKFPTMSLVKSTLVGPFLVC